MHSSFVSASAKPLIPFLEHVREGVLFVEDDMCIGYLNAVARRDIRARGDNPHRFENRSLWELLDYPSDFPSRVAVEQAARDRLPAYFTTRGTRGDYWIETDVIPVDGGVLIYYRDVTPRSAAESARVASESELQMTNERLRVLIDEAPVAIMVLGENDNVQHWNPEAESMFQWNASEVLGCQLPIVPEDAWDEFVQQRTRVHSGESIHALPARRVRRDGIILDVQISASPMRDQRGRIVGRIVMVTDVTENRKLESQLRMAQKMEAVGVLAGGVAHDFNNLLTAIKGFSALLRMTVDDGAPGVEFIAEIDKAADRAAALTAQLLAFSRRQLLRPEPIDLNARVNEIRRMLTLLVQKEGSLVLELGDDVSKVLADPGQIEQVILNLVVNARDAIQGRENGVVTIATSNATLNRQFAEWGVKSAPGEYVCFEVRDNGVGMDRATLARIFDPFFTTKEAGKGTGLGLATVFGIVKQSGGYVWADSKPGEGSKFSVYLPKAIGKRRMSEPVFMASSSGSERILLVEDEAAVRTVARRALELQGYTVLEAADGEAGLRVATEQHFDLLLTDVMMPVMLGPALAAKLRAKHPSLPVLFMSGHTEDISRNGLLDPSIPFLAKPFTPAQLTTKVREILDTAKLIQQS